MIYYGKIDVSEGIHVNETSASKECNICCYWYFLHEEFKFQPDVCNGCLDLSMMSKNLNEIYILNINDVDYCCIISQINKSEAINLSQNANLTKK